MAEVRSCVVRQTFRLTLPQADVMAGHNIILLL